MRHRIFNVREYEKNGEKKVAYNTLGFLFPKDPNIQLDATIHMHAENEPYHVRPDKPKEEKREF